MPEATALRPTTGFSVISTIPPLDPHRSPNGMIRSHLQKSEPHGGRDLLYDVGGEEGVALLDEGEIPSGPVDEGGGDGGPEGRGLGVEGSGDPGEDVPGAAHRHAGIAVDIPSDDGTVGDQVDLALEDDGERQFQGEDSSMLSFDPPPPHYGGASPS